MTVDNKYYEVVRPRGLAEKLLVTARNRIYADFIATCRPVPSDTILDIGISDVLNEGANVLERLYPHRRKITACGIGDAIEFQSVFPEISYIKITPGGSLPFGDQSFDIAFANAVLEHVGGVKQQRNFLSEVARVARRAFITVPNRFFPIEHHTAIPIAHWTDVTFRMACQAAGKEKWTREDQLRLMTTRRLAQVVPGSVASRLGYTGLRLGPFSSNIYLTMANPAS